MGKLLQKLVNGIVPSWLNKINKSSASASPKKLLPSSKGACTSSLPPSSSSSSIRNSTEVLPLVVACDNTNQSIVEDEVEEGRTASIQPKTHKNNENQQYHHHQVDNEPHHPHHVDVKTYNNQDKPEHGTNSCTPPSSRKEQGTPSIHEDPHDHHPQQHNGNCNNGPGLEKRNQLMPEYNNHPQEARSHGHNADHMELDREVNVCVQEDNHQNHHGKEHSHEAEIGYEHYKKRYHDLLRLKRKTQDLQEEEEEEEEEGGSRRSSNIDTTGWAWKRRKGERGVMNCELPESICSIVGNGKAVVKYSQDPQMALWESMVEMIVGNGIWELGNLEFLLFCYLSLNEPHLHPIIQSCFLQVLKDLEKTEF